jgi:hypothetical protein
MNRLSVEQIDPLLSREVGIASLFIRRQPHLATRAGEYCLTSFQLPTCSVNIRSASAAHVSYRSVSAQFCQKGFGLLHAAGCISATSQAQAGGIVAKEIHVHATALQQPGKFPSLVQGVVHARQEAILNGGDAAATGLV